MTTEPPLRGAPQGGLSCPYGAIHLQVARVSGSEGGAIKVLNMQE